jgi:hypothetical protein
MLEKLANIERLELQRGEALVPCTYSSDKRSQWNRKFASCGAMIPFFPNRICPNCGAPQARPSAPAPSAHSRIIEGDVAIVDKDTGKVSVVYVENAQMIASRLAGALRDVVFDTDVYGNASTTTRLSGMAVTHRTFGYQPPQALRKRYGCSRSQFNTQYPEATAILGEFCQLAERTFRLTAEDVYEETAAGVLDSISPTWRINGTPWTSGIINQSASLPYHRDQSNIRGSWSAMLGSRAYCEGGLLHLLDYDVFLPIRHGSISIFDGQDIVHGVTPLRMLRATGWRYTVVLYAKAMMRKCCSTPSDELRRAKAAATAAEDARIGQATAAIKKPTPRNFIPLENR